MSNLLTEELHNTDELGQYRSLSTLAVAAFVLGLLSPLAFVGPLLLAVPLTAIAIACLALMRIHATGDSLTGRPLALVAITLAVLFAVASLTHVFVRDTLSIRLANESARRWLSLVSAGQFDEALELMTPAALMDLQPPLETRDAPRPPFDRAKAVEILGDQPLPHALEPAQEGTEVQFHCHQEQYLSSERDPQVGCMFQASGAQAELVTGSLVLTRSVSPQGEVVWLIHSWKLISPEPQVIETHHHH